MIRLSGHTLKPAGRFTPESMALDITERGSAAQITLGIDAPKLRPGD